MNPTFLKSLEIMLYGMVGIFIVIGVIYLCVFLLGKIFSGKRKLKKNAPPATKA